MKKEVKKRASFTCMQCGKKFYSVTAAEKAMYEGCPKCGASDVDVAKIIGESERNYWVKRS